MCHIIYNYYETFLTSEKEETLDERIVHSASQPFITFNIAIGRGFHIAPLAENLDNMTRDLVKQLSNGLSITGDLDFYLNRIIGLGLHVNGYRATGSHGSLSGTNGILYIGPSFVLRAVSKSNDIEFITRTSVGFLGHQVKVTETLYAGTIGIGLDPSLHLRVANNTYISLGVSFISGQASTYTKQIGEKIKLDNPESLHRINLQLGVRINL
jgi:hypothetical protein